MTTYDSHPTTMSQLRGCIKERVLCLRYRISAKSPLKKPQQQQCHHLHAHHPHKCSPKPRIGLFAHRRSQARRTPSATSKPPVTRSSHVLTRGRVNTPPI